MILFDLPQARHFCSPSATVSANIGRQSLRGFHDALPAHTSRFEEGTNYFQVQQVNQLDSVERWLLYAVGQYRRSLEMLVPISAPWAQVSLYYGSFFAANAILGMFGGWVGQTHTGVRVVDVDRGAPGVQALKVHRKVSSPRSAKGSHRIFWDIFYDATASIVAWAPPSLVGALSPINGDYAWQTAARNNVNYDTYHAWDASVSMYASLKPSKLKTLSGPISLQLDTTKLMIHLGLHFASELSLARGAIEGCGASGTRAQMQKRLVKQAAPNVMAQSALTEFLEA